MGLTVGRYSCPLERTAHAIRASLLAAAVMTTLIGARIRLFSSLAALSWRMSSTTSRLRSGPSAS
jgi:hypothetical protein